jgi:hypothetical protein
MSYLQRPRLHFAGRFEADVSTVNNDPTHFDNATFKPNFDDPGQGATNGWWNPRGTGTWRLIDCAVTGATYANGDPVAAPDPILAMTVEHNGSRVPPKLVDLDPQQQGVSMIWGLEMRVVDASGGDAVRGKFVPSPFAEMWTRAQGGTAGDFAYSAFFQSVLEHVAWGDDCGSTWLRDLRDAAGDGPVSVKFNVDGFSLDSTSPLFCTGRIVGTIGPASTDEPKRFVLGRHLVTQTGAMGNSVAIVDAQARKVYLDLGNALITGAPGGPVTPGTAVFAIGAPQVVLDTIAYGGDGWYESTAGIVESPAGRTLTDDELAAIAAGPLVLADTQSNLLATEAANGTYVRADQFVFRLDAGDVKDAKLYATVFGERAQGIATPCSLQTPFVLGPGGGGQPPLGVPPGALTFPPMVTSDADGVARLTLTASDPGNPRGYIDGQVYAIAYTPDGLNTISVLVFDAVPDDGEPQWWNDLQPVFEQYGNLYPVMWPIVDLRVYDQVAAKRDLLTAVFSLSDHDPNYMPVTRDLSRAKRDRILAWLATTGNGGLPNLGTQIEQQPVAATAAFAAEPAPSAAPAAAAAPVDERGSKTAFALRTPLLKKQVKL